MRRNTFIAITCCFAAFCVGAKNDRAIACFDIADREIRLVCYDREIGELRRTEINNTEKELGPSAETLERETAAVVSPEKSRAKTLPASQPRETSPIESRALKKSNTGILIITSKKRSVRGNWLITLSNGETWMENESNKRPLKIDQEVSISRGPMNYRMTLESGRIIFVRPLD